MNDIENILLNKIQDKGDPFISIIVKLNENDITEFLSDGVNKFFENPIRHSEIDAIENLIEQYGRNILMENIAIFSSAEPCPMCAAAIVYAGISKVVFSVSRDFLCQHGWDEITMTAKDIFEASKRKIEIVEVKSEKIDAVFLLYKKKYSIQTEFANYIF